MNIDISNKTLLELIDYLFQFIQTKITMIKNLKLEDIIYQNAKSKNKRYHQWKKLL